MPKDMASAANLMVHPLAGAAALSALGVGLASQTFGVWMGALTGMVEVSQRLFEPIDDPFPAKEEAFAKKQEKSALSAKGGERQALIEKTRAFAAEKARATSPIKRVPDATVSLAKSAPDASAAISMASGETPAVLMPEDFRQPKTAERPAVPDDLKAISGIGPKLEQVLNGLGIWSYAQVAGWSAEEIAWVEDTLGFKGRIGRDDWLTQAARLAETGK